MQSECRALTEKATSGKRADKRSARALTTDGVFRIEVVGVNEIQAELRGALELMVFDIGGHIGVAAPVDRVLQAPRAAAAHDREPGHRPAARAVAQRRNAETRLAAREKVLQRQGRGQASDPAAAVRVQRGLRLCAEQADQHVVHALLRDVQIGVHGDERDAVFNEREHPALHGLPVGDRAQRGEKQRVVRDNELRAKIHRLAQNLVRRVQGQQDAVHFPVPASDLKPGVVKIHLQLQGRNAAELVKNILYARHASASISFNCRSISR